MGSFLASLERSFLNISVIFIFRYVCTVCGKGFRCSSHLSRHGKRHKTEKLLDIQKIDSDIQELVCDPVDCESSPVAPSVVEDNPVSLTVQHP